MATATRSKGKRATTAVAKPSAAKLPVRPKLPAAPKKGATLHQKFVHLESVSNKAIVHVKKLEKDGFLPKGSAKTMEKRLSGNLDTMISGVRKRYAALPGRTSTKRKTTKKTR